MRKRFSALLDNSGLLVLGTVLALVWANIDRESYEAVAHALHFAVNDVGMGLLLRFGGEGGRWRRRLRVALCTRRAAPPCL